jgi:hypothetical protein
MLCILQSSIIYGGLPQVWRQGISKLGMLCIAIAMANFIEPEESTMGIPERVWKHRFVNQMAELLEKGGMDPDAAVAVSYHHADAHYPERDLSLDPEQESYALYEAMSDNAVEDANLQAFLAG